MTEGAESPRGDGFARDVVLAGVGGHGVISLGLVLAEAARAAAHRATLSEVHGMAQRGGSVLVHLRIADGEISSALIPRGRADLLLATEPLEALRYAELLASHGSVVVAIDPVRNIPDYPEVESLLDALRRLPGTLLVDAEARAKEAGSKKAANLVLAGAACERLGLPPETVEEVIRQAFAGRGQKVVDANLAAFRAGREAAACVRA